MPIAPVANQNPQGQGQGATSAQASKPAAAQPSAPANSNSDSKGGDVAAGVPDKFKKLVKDMNLVKGNINFTNELIDNTPPGEKSETLSDMHRTLTQLEPKLIGMIGQIDDESVMSMCLIVNDDLHKTFERYRSLRKGKTPAKFIPGESTQNTLLTPSHIYSAPVEQSKREDHNAPAS